MPDYFPENNTPLPEDSSNRSLQKINDLLIDGITIGEVEIVPGSEPLPVQIVSGSEPLPVQSGNGTVTRVTGSITTANTSQPVLGSNTNRKYLLFQNVSDTDMYINFAGSAVVGENFLALKNGGGVVFESNFVPTDAVNVICTSSGKKFFILHA